MNILYGKSFLITTLVTSTLLLNGCVGSEHNTTSINSPTILEWQESRNFKYQIDAEGSEPLEYLLSKSADSHLFELDAKTGWLTSATPFDFEAPADSNTDGLYELRIVVIGKDNRAATKDLIVKIADSDEYSVSVSFPAPGSNVGGAANLIHIRGLLNNEGEPLTSVGEDFQVLINGNSAEFQHDGTSNWLAQVEISSGLNSVDIQLLKNGEQIDVEKLEFDNSYVFASSSRVTMDGDIFYAIDLGEKSVLRRSVETGETTEFLSLADVTAQSSCTRFSKLQLLSNTNLIAVICNQNANTQALTLIDIATKVSAFTVTDVGFNLTEPMQLVGDHSLLLRNSNNAFTLYNLADKQKVMIDVFDESGNNYFQDGFFVDGMQVYMRLNGFGWESMAVFDLTQAIESALGQVVATTIGSSVFSYGPAVVFDGSYFFIGAYDIEIINSDMHQSQPISYIGTGDNPLASSGSIAIVYQDGSTVILKTVMGNNMYKLDLISGGLEPLANVQAPRLGDSWQSAMDPQHEYFVTFDPTSLDLYKIDLSDYSLQSFHDMSDIAFDSFGGYGQIDYDFRNDILYRHRVINWGGVVSGDSTPVLLAYSTTLNIEYPIIDGNTLANYFNGSEGVGYRLGETIVTDDPNKLWFSAITLNPLGDDVEGVYSFNLSNGAISPIWEFANTDPEIQPDDPYLSSYSKALNGVILTEWNDGYVKLLNKEGDVQELVDSFSPYLMTHDSDIDEQRNLVYFDGYYMLDGINSPDYARAELVEYNLQDGTHRLIASRELGVGLPISSMSFKLDENRQNLIAPFGGQLLIIDTYTGDRVIKSID